MLAFLSQFLLHTISNSINRRGAELCHISPIQRNGRANNWLWFPQNNVFLLQRFRTLIFTCRSSIQVGLVRMQLGFHGRGRWRLSSDLMVMCFKGSDLWEIIRVQSQNAFLPCRPTEESKEFEWTEETERKVQAAGLQNEEGGSGLEEMVSGRGQVSKMMGFYLCQGIWSQVQLQQLNICLACLHPSKYGDFQLGDLQQINIFFQTAPSGDEFLPFQASNSAKRPNQGEKMGTGWV